MFKSKEEQLAFNESIDSSGLVRDSLGIHTAGWGLTLSPMDMAKIGQLYLNKGIWNGKRIVSEKWVEESTREHSRWKKHDLSYGVIRVEGVRRCDSGVRQPLRELYKSCR